ARSDLVMMSFSLPCRDGFFGGSGVRGPLGFGGDHWHAFFTISAGFGYCTGSPSCILRNLWDAGYDTLWVDRLDWRVGRLGVREGDPVAPNRAPPFLHRDFCWR